MIYKGYELIKAINDKQIKEGTKIRVKRGNLYITTIECEDEGLKWDTGKFNTSLLCSDEISFEIEETIDIQKLEYIDELENGVMGTYVSKDKKAVNLLIKAVKQLDRQMREL